MDMQLIGKGIKTFFIGTFAMMLLYYILPSLITALVEVDTASGYNVMTNEIQGIIWFFVIAIYIIMCIALPANYIIDGIKSQ